MKKTRLIALLAVVLTAFVFVFGCAPQASPSATVTKALNAIKAKDMDTLKSCIQSSGSEDIVEDIKDTAQDMNLSVDDPQIQAFADNIIDRIVQFDYKIGDEHIDGDSATVDVTIDTLDLGRVITDAIGAYFTKGIALSMSGGTEEEMTSLLLETLSESLDKQTEKNYSSTTTIKLVKVDNDWKIDDVSEQNIDSLFGGVMSTFENFAESFGSSLSSAS